MNVPQGAPRLGKAMVRSTQEVPAGMRAAFWREAVSNVLPSIAVDYRTDEPPHARLVSRSFADVRINDIVDKTPSCRVTHTPSKANWPDAYLLALQSAGSGCYRHAGREIVLETGDVILLDLAQALELAFPEEHHELVWVLPRETLAPLLAAPARVPVAVSAGCGLGAVLARSMRMFADEAASIDAASQRTLRLQLCNLAALAVGAAAPVEVTRRRTYRAARRQRILAYGEAHLRDQALTAEKAARDLGMSRRWLHELFSEGGTGFAEWVVRRRVEECRKLLEDPRNDHLPISAVAFCCGFNDLSTFYRQFRARCGMRPREIRHMRPAGRMGS